MGGGQCTVGGVGGQSQDMTVVCELGHLNGGQVVEDLKYHGESLN